MILIDSKTNKIISQQVKITTSFFDRLFGLLNSHNPRFLIFQTHFGIHTIFMKTPIDVVLLDSESKIVKTKEDLLPNQLFLYHPKYSTVIEMPQGTIKKYHLHINDKILTA